MIGRRRAAAAVVLALTFAPMPYVRRELVRRTSVGVTCVDGSRDRALPGKARRRARRSR